MIWTYITIFHGACVRFSVPILMSARIVRANAVLCPKCRATSEIASLHVTPHSLLLERIALVVKRLAAANPQLQLYPATFQI